MRWRRRRATVVGAAVAVLAVILTSGLWFTRADPAQVAAAPPITGRSIHTACNLTLSPDGRWLGTPTPTGFEL